MKVGWASEGALGGSDVGTGVGLSQVAKGGWEMGRGCGIFLDLSFDRKSAIFPFSTKIQEKARKNQRETKGKTKAIKRRKIKILEE